MAADFLIEEPYTAVLPTLVRALGLQGAYVLQAIHWQATGPNGVEYDGDLWAPVTYTDLADRLGIDAQAVRYTVGKLEAEGYLLAVQPEQFNRRKWYRVDRDRVASACADIRASMRRPAALLNRGPAAHEPLIPEDPDLRGARITAHPPGREKKPRARDEVWDALARRWGDGTPEEKGVIAKARASLRKVNATAEEVEAAIAEMDRRFDHPSPMALTKHWKDLLRAAREPEYGTNYWPEIRPAVIADREAAEQRRRRR